MTRRPLRVSFLIDRLSRAGTETQLLALIRHLDRTRVEPSLVLLDGSDAESRSLEPGNCPVLRLGLKSWCQPFAAARAAGKLIAFWKLHHIDVVQTYFLDSTYFGVPLARACGIRTIVRVRNNLGHWLTPRHRMLSRVVGRLAHVTLTNSEPGRLALQAAERGPARKVEVLENGVDLDPFAAVPPPRRGAVITVGAIANLRAVKGIDLLIRAAAGIIPKWPRVRFAVAGAGEQRAELLRQIDDANLSDYFRLDGAVTDIPAWLADIDIGVAPSRAEGMSNALLELMASGRPVVATDVGANRQLLADGAHGLLIPPADVPALAVALERLITDEPLAHQLADAARRHVVNRYNRTAMRLRFEDFYHRKCA